MEISRRRDVYLYVYMCDFPHGFQTKKNGIAKNYRSLETARPLLLGIFAAVFFSNVMLIPSPRVFIPFHLRKKRPRGGLIRDIPQCKSHEIASCAHVHTSSMNLGGNAVIWTLPYVHMTWYVDDRGSTSKVARELNYTLPSWGVKFPLGCSFSNRMKETPTLCVKRNVLIVLLQTTTLLPPWPFLPLKLWSSHASKNAKWWVLSITVRLWCCYYYLLHISLTKNTARSIRGHQKWH